MKRLVVFILLVGLLIIPPVLTLQGKTKEKGFTITFKWSQGMGHNLRRFYHNVFVFAGVRSSFFPPEF